MFCFRLPYPLKIQILYFWTDFAGLGLKGKILGADSKSEAIFYHFCNFSSEKTTGTP